MRNAPRRLVACVALIGLTLPDGLARAATFFSTGDTGNPVVNGWFPDESQWLAGQITLNKPHTVTGVEFWLGERSDPGDVLVVVYGDGGFVPDTGDILFSTSFFADGPGGDTASWLGPSGLNWTLGPGTYWVALEVRNPSPASFLAPDPVPQPLNAYAFTASSGWDSYPLNFGVRLHGEANQTVVPEPATLTLPGLGFGGLAARRLRLCR